jgi:hypothetical protein
VPGDTTIKGSMAEFARTADAAVVDVDAGRLALLRDHLETSLGFGEALLEVSFEVTARVADGATIRAILKQNRLLADVVAEARGLELALILRLMRAAEFAGLLARRRSDLAAVLDVFRSGVAPALRLASEIDPAREGDAERPLAWLRHRGLLGDDIAGLADLGSVRVTEHMRIGGAVDLGVILDAAAALLDALDAADLRPGRAPEEPA